jgi:hypothetical protein
MWPPGPQPSDTDGAPKMRQRTPIAIAFLNAWRGFGFFIEDFSGVEMPFICYSNRILMDKKKPRTRK